MKKTCSLLFLIAALSFTGIWTTQAQVTIDEAPAVKQMMDNFVRIGKEEPYIDGWRIKLISTTDRRAMESARWLFENKYPDMVYSQDYEAPYYSMKVGAYEDRFAVEPMLVKFKEDFPLALPYRDKIMKTELFNQNGDQ